MNWWAVLVGWVFGSLPAFLSGLFLGARIAHRRPPAPEDHPGFADLSGWCVCGLRDVNHDLVGNTLFCPVPKLPTLTFTPPHKESNA